MARQPVSQPLEVDVDDIRKALELLRAAGTGGNLTTDAQLASLALRHQAVVHCEVTGLDYVPELIERAKQRATADDLDVEFKVGDAQKLPFPDGYFDVAVRA